MYKKTRGDPVKAELIEKLIIAHCSGSEEEFHNALMVLAKDEERKGNVRLSAQIISAYKGKTNGNVLLPKRSFAPQKNNELVPQGAAASVAPRDKDSMLELLELIYTDTCIDDVILPKSQKQVLTQIIEEQTQADEFLKHNIFPANRLLLCGPPGCGKTMTAHAIAHELNLPMAYVRLDGLVSSYLGQTSTNLRKVFDAVKNQKIVLFLDEFDAIAKKRDDGNELGELKRVVTTLLQNFDNMPNNVFLIAATNHQHLLDPAVWRRFNLTIVLELPNEDQRCELVEKWMAEFNLTANINIKQLGKLTEGLNCAQLKELIITAAKRFHARNKELSNDDVISILIQQLTLYSGNNDEMWNVLQTMNDKGIGLRTLAKATDMAHSTLKYRLDKNAKGDEMNG